MKKIAIATHKNQITDFRSCTSFSTYDIDEQGQKIEEKEQRAKSCAGIIDKVFQLIDEKIELLYVKEILDEDKTVLENANIEVIKSNTKSNIEYL